MGLFRRHKKKSRTRRALRRVVAGFIIGGAITSIIGHTVLKERRRQHLGEEREE